MHWLHRKSPCLYPFVTGDHNRGTAYLGVGRLRQAQAHICEVLTSHNGLSVSSASRASWGAFHSTKNSRMKFRVFHVTNGTVFFGWLDQAFPGFAREYEVNKGNKWWRTLYLFYLLWSCSTTPEVKTSGVFIRRRRRHNVFQCSCSLYKRRNWNRVRELFDSLALSCPPEGYHLETDLGELPSYPQSKF